MNGHDDQSVPVNVFFGASDVVHLIAPSGADRQHLPPARPQGNAPKPFMQDDGVTRALHFSAGFVQSEMCIEKPYALALRYTRKMMAFLLFRPLPKSVTIVGLGGGSLTKFCYHQLPRARITTVEINHDVIELSPLFHVPGESERMSIVHADAADYFAATPDRVDVILLDGCDANGIAPAFSDAQFYRNLRGRLRPGGVLVANLVGSVQVVELHVRLIAETFANQLIVQNVSREGNRVAFAFNDPWLPPDWAMIQLRAKRLQRRHGLDYPAFARRLRRTYEQQKLRRGI
ncbi:MAG: spermidine synthase [Nevskia sp.]|nr:spermidine synthase [Nevskia sp.]